MFGHHNVAIDTKLVVASDSFNRRLKNIFCRWRHEKRAAMMTRKRDKVTLPGFVKAFQSPRHGSSAYNGELPHSSPTEGLEWATRPTRQTKSGQGSGVQVCAQQVQHAAQRFGGAPEQLVADGEGAEELRAELQLVQAADGHVQRAGDGGRA